MRKKLGKIYGKRDKFYGLFGGFGQKRNWKTGMPEKTVLLLDIRDKTGKVLTDHLWFNYTKEFQKIEPLEGDDLIRFHARVSTYYKREGIDYKLSHPTKMHKMSCDLFGIRKKKAKEES